MTTDAMARVTQSQALPVEHLVRLHLELTRGLVSPGGPEGGSVRVGILDGTVDGPAMRGRVAPLVGGVVAHLRGEGDAHVVFELVLVSDDHAHVDVRGEGILRLSERRVLRGGCTFHTGVEHLAWLNHVHAVCLGTGGRDELTVDLHQVL
ncbi:MAG: DUF3237 family protein [Ilumatobacteraceae bacterium]|nr:DUF3237 family protein [Acidimicrobiales bacterium]MCB9392152.1 DUF3237 family protein [Acidimicrobiaceae bacterium]